MNDPVASARIRVRAVENSSEVLYQGSAEVVTGGDGSYDFNLLDGKFIIEVNTGEKYPLTAYVTVDGTVASTISLPGLIENHGFCTPQAPDCTPTVP